MNALEGTEQENKDEELSLVHIGGGPQQNCVIPVATIAPYEEFYAREDCHLDRIVTTSAVGPQGNAAERRAVQDFGSGQKIADPAVQGLPNRDLDQKLPM